MKADTSAGKPHNGKYVAYYRVSTDRQGASGLGLEAQRDAVLSYLNGGSWTLKGEFVEVESGRTQRRPELMKALEVCRKEKATLVVAKLDRLYRNLHAMTSLMQAGIDFVAADNPHANKLTIHLLAAIAEHERDLTGQKRQGSFRIMCNPFFQTDTTRCSVSPLPRFSAISPRKVLVILILCWLIIGALEVPV